ncbi:hypothetical protein Tco_0584492 [Tanacetum coccineum]
MLPTRRTTRTTPATTTTPTTTVTNAQLQALIDQGVAAALAERDASRSRDGDNSHEFKGTEGFRCLTNGHKMDLIHGSVKASKGPQSMPRGIGFLTEMIGQKDAHCSRTSSRE